MNWKNDPGAKTVVVASGLSSRDQACPRHDLQYFDIIGCSLSQIIPTGWGEPQIKKRCDLPSESAFFQVGNYFG